MNIPVYARAALLQVLTAGPGYGLELVERVRSATDGRIRLAHGGVYAHLRAMVREGLVARCSPARSNRGGPNRTRYTLTARGADLAKANFVVVRGLFAFDSPVHPGRRRR